MNTNFTQSLNNFKSSIKRIFEPQEDDLAFLLTGFLSSNWLDQLTAQQQLEALYTLLYTPGHIQHKLEQLSQSLHIPNILQHIEAIENSSTLEKKKEYSIIQHFNHEISEYIDPLQATQARLLNFEEQYEFACKQMAWDTSSFTYYSPLPVTAQQIQNFTKALKSLHNIIKKVEYLYKYNICDTWEGTNVMTVTVLNQHIANLLSFKQSLKQGTNFPGDHKVSFYGQTWILDRLNATLHTGFNKAIDHYALLNTQLKAITLPPAQMQKTIDSFTQSMDLLFNTLNECNISHPAMITRFNPMSKKTEIKKI